MESGENHEQEESKRKGQIPGTMERMHGRRRYLGKQRELEEYNGVG